MFGHFASMDLTYIFDNLEKHKKMKISRTKSTDELFDKFIAYTLSDIAKKKRNIRNKII